MSPSIQDRARWSVRPNGGEPDVVGRERVVLTPPSTPLNAGFELARRELSKGAAVVRLVGRGVTRRSTWPSWVTAGEYDLLLTEIDAYLPPDKASLTRDLLPDFEQWLAKVFAGALPLARPERVFWGSAMYRIFRHMFESWPLVIGLANCHGHDDIVCADPRWRGLDALRVLAERKGGEVSPRRPKPIFQYEIALFGLCVASLIGFCLYRLHEFWRERTGRNKLARLRRELTGEPQVWMGLLGDWPRACRHVLESVSEAAADSGERPGVILQNTLLPGLRCENDPHSHTGYEVFPALEHPLLAGRIAAVEQCASAETLSELVRTLAAAVRASARGLWRVCRHGSQLKLGPLPIDLRAEAFALARLLTIDVVRAIESSAAAERLAARRELRGAKIVWPHASLAHAAAPDLVLQSAGAVTYDLVHGALAEAMDMVTFERTHTTVKVVWTQTEAEYLAPYTAHQRREGGVLPRPLPRPREPRAIDGPARILALTNYVHGGTRQQDFLPLECFQEAFFEALSQALNEAGRPVTLRWRPHPSDDRASVEAAAARYAHLSPQLSLEPGELASDLAWADVILTSLSTSIVEALCHPAPLFVHELPAHESTGPIASIEPARRFQNGEELAPRLAECLAALAAQDPDALAPEAALRHRFFGPSGTPRGIGDLLWPGAAE